MSNLLSPHAPFQSFWRGKNPGISEFTTLLGLLNTPALILEPRQNHILTANSEFLKLTAFSINEIVQIELRNLFPDISRYEIVQLGDHPTRLARHSREPVDVIVRPTPLDANGNWHLLTVIPQDQFTKDLEEQNWQEKYISAFQSLYSIISQPDLPSSLGHALEVGQNLLASRYLAVYQYDSKVASFRKVSTTENLDAPIFPLHVAASSIQPESRTDIWIPGKRVVNEFQRIARIGNLPYMAVHLLYQDTANLGILAVSDTQGQPATEIEKVLEILGVSITNALYHHILVQNLNDTVSEHRKAMLIRDSAMENAQEGIIIVRKNLTVESMNPAAEMILGYGVSEVVDVPLENILVGTETLIPALKAAMDGIPTHNLGNISLHRRNGQTFVGHLQTIPVMVDDGLLSIVVILRDESENEQIRVHTQQLEQRAILGEVTAIFAHEVRNPINNISTGLQVLQMNYAADDPHQETIARLQHDCNRLTHLMESVLTFSRTTEYKMEPTDIELLLRRILDRWRPRFSKANVNAFFQIDPNTPWVIGDQRALEQVFTNLISNAVQAMKNGGLLAVKITSLSDNRSSPEVEITVSDEGPGIPDEIKDHIFEPFITTNPQGTGLGLAITKRIVNAHRGSINVNSFPGGTVFQICLPATKPIRGAAT